MKMPILFMALLVMAGAQSSFGLDLGPVHIRGTDVKVGNEVNYDVTVDKITKEEAKKDESKKEDAKKEEAKDAKIQTIYGHRKDENDKFEISVSYDDLDKESKSLLGSLEKDKSYKMKIKRMDENWKLIRLREK